MSDAPPRTPLRLATTSRRRLLDATDANLVLHKGWIAGRTPGMELRADDELTVVDCGLAVSNFNCALRSRLDPARAADRITGVVEHFHAAGVPFSWWAGDHDRPGDLAGQLRDAGFGAVDRAVAMALDLDALEAGAAPPAELRVEPVRDGTGLEHFARLTAATWTPGDDTIERYYAAGAPALLAPGAALRFYVGYVDGEPVATAELTAGPGLVGIYNIATLPPYRRRGYGSALTLRPLLDARAEGFHTAVLQASAEGEGVYRRLGFRTTGRYTIHRGPEPRLSRR